MRIVTHILGLCVVVLLALALLYLTRFWIFTDLWDNDGLWGIKELHRNGDFLARQLRGTPYQVFSLLFWLVGGILALSLLQTVPTRIGRLFARH